MQPQKYTLEDQKDIHSLIPTRCGLGPCSKKSFRIPLEENGGFKLLQVAVQYVINHYTTIHKFYGIKTTRIV